MNREHIRSLEDWIAYERRAWYSAWADRGLAIASMSHDEASAVRAHDAYLRTAMTEIQKTA